MNLIRHAVRSARSLMSPIKRPLDHWADVQRGLNHQFPWRPTDKKPNGADNNPLRAFSNNRTEGRGIWKWDHYFDIYDRHLKKFRGTDVRILEIGIYSGGSLDMWHDYFGPKAHVYGVDIQPDCKVYADDKTTIFIGDQSDPAFWAKVRKEAPRIDVIIDDGSHWFPHQVVTLEQMLPHISPGGVFICEDVHFKDNEFTAYVAGLSHQINDHSQPVQDLANADRRISSKNSAFQARVNSIHTYPYVVAIEINDRPVPEFVSPKRGTQWQPFLT